MQEIKITRAATLKEKPDSSTLVFGKSFTPTSLASNCASMFLNQESVS